MTALVRVNCMKRNGANKKYILMKNSVDMYGFVIHIVCRFHIIYADWCKIINYYANRTEWSPIRSVNVTSDKQNWTSAGRESNLYRKLYDFEFNLEFICTSELFRKYQNCMSP